MSHSQHAGPVTETQEKTPCVWEKKGGAHAGTPAHNDPVPR